MTSRPFDSFVAPARERPQIWRLLVGCLLIAIVYAVGIALVFVAAWVLLGLPMDTQWLEEVMVADTPRPMIILLSTFAGMALGPMIAVVALHRRGAGTLFGPASRCLRDFVIATGVALGFTALSFLAWTFFHDAVPNLGFGQWIVLLPVALLLLLVQTGAEELLFRGYLLQQLGARFRSPLAWLIVPSVIFGFFHYDPASAGANTWLVVGSAGFFGLLAADLTARTGSLGAAWGFHFANNFVALTLVATKGQLNGLALYVTPYTMAEAETVGPLIFVDLAFMVAIWFVLRRLLGR